MIKLLAPTTVASADDESTAIIEMSTDVVRALHAGVTVAFEDDASVPDDLKDAATELWRFFVEGTETP